MTAVTQKRPGLARPARRRGRGVWTVPVFLVVPALLLVLAIRIAPAAAGGWYAFTNWNGVSAGAHYVGFRNFQEIFSAAGSEQALIHTVILGGAFVVLTNVIGLGLAVGLQRGIKTGGLLRILFFLPAVLTPVSLAYTWSFIFADPGGAFNSVLGFVGLASAERAWLGDPSFALWAILIVMVWQYSGLAMIIYLAGLQGVPIELEEAASVDQATAWLRFREVTLPLLAPAITVSTTFMLVMGLRVFDQIIAMTSGGPDHATDTLATQVYEQAFELGHFGYAAALALVLAALIFCVSLIQVGLLRTREARL